MRRKSSKDEAALPQPRLTDDRDQLRCIAAANPVQESEQQGSSARRLTSGWCAASADARPRRTSGAIGCQAGTGSALPFAWMGSARPVSIAWRVAR